MTEVGITVVFVALLVAVLIFLKKRKGCTSCCSSKETPESELKVPEQVKQQPEIKAVDKPIVNVEPASAPQDIAEAAVVSSPEPKPADKPTPPAKSPAKETVVISAENYSSLPQDSILKRHYLAHVSAMIEALACPRPADSVLCRHYDAMIVAEIDRCLTNKNAMEQLIHNYENKK